MCGIAGPYNFQRRDPAERGYEWHVPLRIVADDESFFIAGPVGLGFRPLSIIDLAGSRQPMSD